MSTRVALNQPYLYPYKGYYDLINSVDKFVIYDDAQWISGGWINRNYFPKRFTFPVSKPSSKAKINECYFHNLEETKRKFKKIVDSNVDVMQPNFNVSYNIYLTLKDKVDTPIYFSSNIPHGTRTQGVLDIVKALGGTTYVNLPNGKSIYKQEDFGDIKLEFIETKPSHSILCECCS